MVATAVSSVLMTAQWTGVRVGDIAAVEVATVGAVVVLGARPLWHFIRTAPWLLWLPVLVLVGLDVVPGREDTQLIGVTTALSLFVCWYVVAEGRERGRIPWSSAVDLLVWSALANALVATLSALTNGAIAWPWGLQFVDRQVGLTTHPTQLALSCVVGLAFVLFGPPADHARGDLRGIARDRRHMATIATIATVLFLGVLVSGSRAGLAVSVVLVVAMAWVHVALRRPSETSGVHEARLMGGRVAALAVVGAVCCVVGTVTLLRVGGRSEASMEQSDGLRSAILDDVAAQVRRSPVLGAGSDHLLSAHNVPLQLLAAGGVVLLLAFVPMLWTAVRPAFARNPLGTSVPVVAWLAFSMVQNPIVDRFVHLVIAIAVVAQSGARSPSKG
jgi:hypothetical protein